MARIAGVDLPRYKKIEYALTYIHGIGQSISSDILDKYYSNIDKEESFEASKYKFYRKLSEVSAAPYPERVSTTWPSVWP